MKYQKIIYYLITTIILFIPNIVGATRCNNTEKVALASLAQNISITYDYVEQNHQVSFYIIFSNLQPGLKIKDVMNNKEYYYNGPELVLPGYQPGKNYRFDIYAATTCDSRLYSHYVSIPGYNPYYDDPICQNMNIGLCQKWVTVTYDYNTFVNEVNKYKQNNTIQIEEEQEEVLGIYDYIFNFFANYYYIIFPIIIVAGITGIIILRKKDDLF